MEGGLISQGEHSVDLHLGESRSRVVGRHQESQDPGIRLLTAMGWAHL